MANELKRKRGAQPGNRNARKHGLYSSTLTADQLCQFWNTLNLGSTEPELVAISIKLNAALRYAPGNRRVLKEAAKLLAKWYRSKCNLDTEDNVVIKKYIRSVLEAIIQKSIDFNGTNHS